MKYGSFNHRINIGVLSICLLTTALVCLIGQAGYAQETFYWTGGADSSTWAKAGNWSGSAGGYPGQDDTDGSVYNFARGAKVDVAGTWTLTGSPADFSILAENFGKKVGKDVPAAPSQGGENYSGGQITLKLPERLPHKGDTIEVDVVAWNAWMKAYSFMLSYDKSLLKLIDVEEGNFLKDPLFLFHNNRVLCASRSGPSRGDGLLARIRFQVIGEGRSREGITFRDIQVVDGEGRLGRLGEMRVPFCTAPRRTRLLASYPNPFNSEVWIPFQLAEDADVRVEIYDVSGRVVRVLDLGRLPAGYYVDRSTAAHWDGRSDVGERVASGVYLYRFSAGDYTAVRRMVILK